MKPRASKTGVLSKSRSGKSSKGTREVSARSGSARPGNAAPALAAANAARKARRSHVHFPFLPVVGNGPLREVSLIRPDAMRGSASSQPAGFHKVNPSPLLSARRVGGNLEVGPVDNAAPHDDGVDPRGVLDVGDRVGGQED